ncbi:MAG: HEAT repeat domain-containing protein [Verrucomicrobia bacterium]|nr:MAG: HEAT repeat domain-containing protein [Verrucomicrobiota bacterium]
MKAALLDMAATPAVNSALRLEALDTLGQSKARDAVAGLEPLLTDGDRAIRAAAMKAVAQIGGEEALRALRPLASDSDLCREAVIALGSLRDTNAVPDLLAAWRAPETRQEALAGLAQVSDLRALDAYLEGLASANAALREQCRKAVTQVREAALPRRWANCAASTRAPRNPGRCLPARHRLWNWAITKNTHSNTPAIRPVGSGFFLMTAVSPAPSVTRSPVAAARSVPT